MGSAPDQIFLDALDTFDRQVGEVTQFWFVAATINEVARTNRRVFRAFQSSALFWLTVRAGLQYQAIIALGRIFGQRGTNSFNIDSLRDAMFLNRQIFSRTAFAARGKNPELVARVHEPTVQDFRRLSEMIKKYRKIYEGQFRPIRDSHVAHTVVVDATQLSSLFSRTRLRDFQRSLSFLNGLHDALWHMYHNGLKPTVRLRRWSVKALVREPLRNLSRTSIQEDTVRQTRQCLALLVGGLAAESTQRFVARSRLPQIGASRARVSRRTAQ